MQPDDNPYTAPSPAEAIHPDPRNIALNRLRGPSLGLLILSIGYSLLTFYAVLNITSLLLLSLIRGVGSLYAREILILVAAPVNWFIVLGSFSMRRGTSYPIAVAAATLSCIPLLSPLLCIGIPFGIWALVELRRKDVRAAFEANATP